MEEQEIFDEYMRLCDLQEKDSKRNSKGFSPSDSAYNHVHLLMHKMRTAGLKVETTVGFSFHNWFFRCKDRTFSICVYNDGWMELRWY
jgi:hypothetical protein